MFTNYQEMDDMGEKKMEVAVLNIEKSELLNNSKERLGNRLWDLLVQGEMTEDENVKKQFSTIENAIKNNKKHDR